MADPSEIGVSGPLAPWATGFASSLVRQGYTPNSAISQMHLMAHLSRWLAGEGVAARGAPRDRCGAVPECASRRRLWPTDR
jgi:hypothetical protein